MNALNHFKPKIEGRGVRRLNRKPLLVVAGIVGLAGAAIAYTYIQRVNSIQAAPETAQPNPSDQVAPADPGDLLSKAPREGAIPAADRPVIPAAGLPPLATGSAPLPTSNPVGQLSPEELQRRQAWLDYYEGQRKVDEQRQKNSIAALDAPTSARRGVGATDAVAAESGTSVMANGALTVPGTSGVGGLLAPPAAAAAANPLAGLLGRPPGIGDADSNGQVKKAAYLGLDQEETLMRTRDLPASKFEIRAGTIFPSVMVGGANSDLPGQIIAQITENVRDTATGDHILVPQGSKLVGSYDNGITYGQERVLVAWNRVIYPDGSSLTLNKMPGADQGGYAGLSDKVDNHYMRIFASTTLMSVLAAAAQLSQPQAAAGQNISTGQTIAGVAGQNISDAGASLMQKNLGIAPTLTIRPGYQFNVMVTKDIIFDGPWIEPSVYSPQPRRRPKLVQIAADGPMRSTSGGAASADVYAGTATAGQANALSPTTKPLKVEKIWSINAGEDFFQIIRRWATEENWRVPQQWSTTDRWTVTFSDDFTGDFEKAVLWLCSGFSNQSRQPVPIFWPNRVIDFTSMPHAHSAPQSAVGVYQ